MMGIILDSPGGRSSSGGIETVEPESALAAAELREARDPSSDLFDRNSAPLLPEPQPHPGPFSLGVGNAGLPGESGTSPSTLLTLLPQLVQDVDRHLAQGAFADTPHLEGNIQRDLTRLAEGLGELIEGSTSNWSPIILAADALLQNASPRMPDLKRGSLAEALRQAVWREAEESFTASLATPPPNLRIDRHLTAGQLRWPSLTGPTGAPLSKPPWHPATTPPADPAPLEFVSASWGDSSPRSPGTAAERVADLMYRGLTETNSPESYLGYQAKVRRPLATRILADLGERILGDDTLLAPTKDRWIQALELWATRQRGIPETRTRPELWTYTLMSVLETRGADGVRFDFLPPNQDRETVIRDIQRAIDSDEVTGRIRRHQAEKLRRSVNLLRNRLDPPNPRTDLARMESLAPRIVFTGGPSPKTVATESPWLTDDVVGTLNRERLDLGVAWIRQRSIDLLSRNGSRAPSTTLEAHISEAGDLFVAPEKAQSHHAVIASYGDVSLEVYTESPSPRGRLSTLRRTKLDAKTLSENTLYWGVVIKTAYGNHLRFPLFGLYAGPNGANTLAPVGEGLNSQAHNHPELVQKLRLRIEQHLGRKVRRQRSRRRHTRGPRQPLGAILDDELQRLQLSGKDGISRRFLEDLVDLVEANANPSNDFAVNLLRALNQYKHGDIRGPEQSTRDMMEDQLDELRTQTKDQRGSFATLQTVSGDREVYVMKTFKKELPIAGRPENFNITLAFDGTQVGDTSGLRMDSWTLYLAVAEDTYASGPQQWRHIPRYRLRLDELNRVEISQFENQALPSGHDEWVEKPMDESKYGHLLPILTEATGLLPARYQAQPRTQTAPPPPPAPRRINSRSTSLSPRPLSKAPGTKEWVPPWFVDQYKNDRRWASTTQRLPRVGKRCTVRGTPARILEIQTRGAGSVLIEYE